MTPQGIFDQSRSRFRSGVSLLPSQRKEKMNLRALVPFISIAALAACLGGGSNGIPGAGSNSTPQQSATIATGSLTIAIPQAAQASSSARKPSYISPSTKHAAVFIDGAKTAAGSATCTSPCTSLTINWTGTSGSHSFAVESDDGSPFNYVLAEGIQTYTLVAGANGTLTPKLTLNGVAYGFIAITVVGCVTNVQAPSVPYCSGTFAVTDVDGNLIVPPGDFDNGPITFLPNGVGNGQFSNGQCSSPNLTSLCIPNTSGGGYGFLVSCNTGATGTFYVGSSFTSGSGDVTAAELSGLSPAVTYPNDTGLDEGSLNPVFTCTNGVISAPATGTIPIQ
jgi:hypothetical protein